MIIKSGDIEVILNDPLFSGNSTWYPGYAETRSFQVKNRGNKTKTAQIEALSETEKNNLSQGLNLQIRDDISCVYGCGEAKTLKNFFDAGTLNLGQVPADDNGRVFTIIAAMPLSAENKYQDGKASFDLKIGFEGDAASAVTVQSDSTITSSSTPTSVVLGDANTANLRTNDTNIVSQEGKIWGEEVTPAVTDGAVMGETANINDHLNNWWSNGWWLMAPLALVAMGGWWNGRRNSQGSL